MLWPEETTRNTAGELTIGGISAVALAEEFGTPLYVFDETTLRNRARRAVASALAGGPGSRAVFASKALELPRILSILADEGLGIDVVSGGELFVALHSGIDPHVISFNGNNKSQQELREAIDAGADVVLLDNFTPEQMEEAVAIRDEVRREVILEASGGLTLQTARRVGETGVDYIAVGELTHSVTVFDIGLDLRSVS